MREILLEFGLNFPEAILFLGLFMVKFNIGLKENKFKVGISLLLLTFSNYYLPTLVSTFSMHLFVLFTSFTLIMSVIFNQNIFKTFLSVFKTFVIILLIEAPCVYLMGIITTSHDVLLNQFYMILPAKIIEFSYLYFIIKRNIG